MQCRPGKGEEVSGGIAVGLGWTARPGRLREDWPAMASHGRTWTGMAGRGLAWPDVDWHGRKRSFAGAEPLTCPTVRPVRAEPLPPGTRHARPGEHRGQVTAAEHLQCLP
jgi:hypothetical protein